ncbi:MAG: DUF2325 domain-containing protein [Deltaproteobacteria bacterium]|nr:DUF2325 domain-containing protein [Deltaproteobacteria bacterium]
MHCSILGTCLTIGDLKRIVNRLGLEVDNETTDYELHSVFVNAVATRNQISRLVDKLLEKKHQRTLRVFRRCDTETELKLLWQQEVVSGDVKGAYWALMSHRLLNDELRKLAFGDVHMLSHVLAASRNTTRQQLAKAESQLVEKEQKLSLTKQVFRKRLRDRDARIDELQKSLTALKDVERKLALAHNTIFEIRKDSGVAKLESRLLELSESLRKEKQNNQLADATLSRIGDELVAKTLENRRINQKLIGLTNENKALEQLLTQTVGCPNAQDYCEHQIHLGDGSLCGRKIMYIGGRDNLIPHYRQLIHFLGGDLIYHDGWMSQSIDGLKKSLDNVDLVVCPVDCVSHGACQQIKAACKNKAVPFVPLRSLGLSSLARGISEYA